MRSLFTKTPLPVVLSAILSAIAIMQVQFWLAWLALIPFFTIVYNAGSRKALWSGITYGVVFCAVMLYRMVALVGEFSGKIVYGFVFYGIALLMSALYFGLLTTTISWLVRGHKPIWLKATLCASLWTLGEWTYSIALPGMPWFGLFRVSNMVLDNLYAIQISTLGGAFLISFFIVLVNCMAACFIAERRWKHLSIPLALTFAYMLLGYSLHSGFREDAENNPDIKVAILRDNTPPGVKWDEKNGSSLVKNLLDLNKEAIATKPDIALWSESIVPWTYRADDDFINEVLKAGTGTDVSYIVGMMSDYSETEVYNSAYAITADGKVSGRYDKRFPVSFAETPTALFTLPFAGASGRSFEKAGESLAPLPTPQGRAGVLICNDATVPAAAVSQVLNKADFLVSLSNDAWFSNVDFLVRQHFYNTRLRAVEVRKDLAINCNMGFSGLVKATGELSVEGPAPDRSVQLVNINPNKVLTIYASYSCWFIYTTALFVIIFIVLNIVYYLKPV